MRHLARHVRSRASPCQEDAIGRKDPRVTAYIARSAPFARPVLRHLRAVVHAGCPKAAETIKWGMPAFVHEGNLCFVAAFKAHVGLVFWKGRKVVPASRTVRGAMGQFGRITSLADLPARSVLVGYVRRAAALNEAGVRARRKPARRTPTAPPKPRAARPAARGRATSPNPGTRNARRRAAR